MVRKAVPLIRERKSAWPLPAPKISLTLAQGPSGQLTVKVSIAEFIAYSQNTGFTRLSLTGGKVLDVKETTDQIDRLVRVAACQSNPVIPQSSISGSF